MFLKILFVSIVLLLSSASYSQPLRHTLGSDVIVIDSNNSKEAGSAIITISAAEVKTLSGSQLLSLGASVISPSLDIRSYGSLGGIALATYRGLPAEFVTVEYNGIKLVNTQHSLNDLALIDINLLNTISLSSAPANLGAGDNGFGMIRLDGLEYSNSTGYFTVGSNLTSYNDKLRIAEHNTFLKLAQRISQSLNITAGVSISGADGKYPFTQQIHENTTATVLRENNSAQLANVSLDLNYTPANEITIKTFTLYSKADRGIPGANTVSYRGTSSPDANQFDEQYIVGLSLDHHPLEYFSYTFKSSFQSLFETYTNPQTAIFDRYTNHNYTLDWESKTHFWKYFDFYGTASFHRYTLISNENIIGSADSLISRNVYRSNLGLGYRLDYFSATAFLKTELYTGNDEPQILPQINVQQQFFIPDHRIVLGAAYSKMYHAPTFNELYWKVGGNKNLLPEEGDAFEVSGNITREKAWYIKAVGFYNLLKNQIIWLPGASGIFTPTNLRSVRSYGLELTFEGAANQGGDIEFHLRGGLSLESAENISTGSPDSTHEIPYSTQRRWNLSLTTPIVNIGEFVAAFLYRSHRYTTIANTDKLPEVGLLNVSYTSVPINIYDQFKATFSFSINNLFDKQYEEIKSYPLPGRVFRLGLEFTVRSPYREEGPFMVD